MRECPECGGYGRVERYTPSRMMDCPTCKGVGKVPGSLDEAGASAVASAASQAEAAVPSLKALALRLVDAGEWQPGFSGSGHDNGANIVSFGGDDIVHVANVPSKIKRQYIMAAQPKAVLALIATNEELTRVCKLVLAGLQSGSVKSKPLMDFSNPNAESLKLESLDEIIGAALAKVSA